MPVHRIAFARLAYHKNYRTLRPLVAIRYSKNILLYDQKIYVRFSIEKHLLISRLDCSFDSQTASIH